MSFRQVIVKEAKYLHLEHHNLVCNQDDKIMTIPIEDIALIVIENSNSIISIKVLNKCMEEKIAIIFCNDKKIPSGLIIPFNTHYRLLEVINLQLGFQEVKKNNLWREIIKQKIHNQAKVIQLTTNNHQVVDELYKLKDNVKRNDIDNREALAARLFFKELYGEEFIRFKSDTLNTALNYGYAVIASTIIRNLVSYGIDPKFGIWHKSKSNAFNLAYDIIEPFRPLVDYYISEKITMIKENLTPQVRREIVGLLNCNVLVNNKKYRMQNAIDMMCKQYSLILQGVEKELLLVEIIEVNFYEY